MLLSLLSQMFLSPSFFCFEGHILVYLLLAVTLSGAAILLHYSLYLVAVGTTPCRQIVILFRRCSRLHSQSDSRFDPVFCSLDHAFSPDVCGL